MQGLDLQEMRAVYAALPSEARRRSFLSRSVPSSCLSFLAGRRQQFENDPKGAKAEWRAVARRKLEEMVSKSERGARAL